MTTTRSSKLARIVGTTAAIVALLTAMGGDWRVMPASATPVTTPTPAPAGVTSKPTVRPDPEVLPPVKKPALHELAGKLNLNAATEEQLMRLPSVGPSKAERIVTWRKKNGGFKRVADLRRVKGFGYKTFKRLEPFLDIKGDTTLAAK